MQTAIEIGGHAHRASARGEALATRRPAFEAAERSVEADPLERLGTNVRYDRNRTIYCEGDEADYCFKVLAGTVRLCKMMEDGRRQIAAFLTAGDLFGWVDRDAYNFSAEAVTDVVIEKFQRRRVDAAAKEDPVMGRRLMGVLSMQLASAHNHLLLLGRMTAAERIATFLLDRFNRQCRVKAEGETIDLPMSRKDLADYLGLTVETVSRVMNGLKRKGVIFFATPEIVRLKQTETLERLALAA